MDYLLEAVKEAKKGLKKKEGGPFGAVIVCNGKLIAKAHNTVLKTDATSHAEINVIREASKKLKTYDLSGCELYVTCEPCPMCFSAIYWANIKTVYYSSTRKDAKKMGFRDKELYEILNGQKKSKLKMKKIKCDSCKELTTKFIEDSKKELY